MRSNRQEAREAGDVKFLGRVCTSCGGNVRYTRSGCCVECQRKRDLRACGQRQNDPRAFSYPVFVLGKIPESLKK